MVRKYSNLTVDEIEVVSQRNLSNPHLLRQLADELGHRTRGKAARLRSQLQGLLGSMASDSRVRAVMSTRPSPTQSAPASVRQAWDPRSGVVCLDFGTSSVRAALSDGGEVRVLRIGEVCRSSIDDQSIPSAVFVPGNGTWIYFGQRAIEKAQEAGAAAEGGVLELSPKKWFVDGSSLDAPLSRLQQVTRRQLLVGLLSFSLAAAAKAAQWDLARMARIELRVAHPVWDKSAAEGLRRTLDDIVHRAVAFLEHASDAVRASSLQHAVPEAIVVRHSNVDVKEPIAAAIDLIGAYEAQRQAIVVVDVGAGTIDLAFLASMRPELRDGTPKLIPLAEPVSLFKAGDALDEVVHQLLLERMTRRPSQADRADLLRRRRQIKETLFRSGHVAALGAKLSLAEVEDTDVAKGMAHELRSGFMQIVKGAEVWMKTTGSVTSAAIGQIDVVFAGGGSSIEFLRRALPKRLTVAENRPALAVRIRDEGTVAARNASEGRLAVARGGVVDEDLWPTDALKVPRSIPGLGAPLHPVQGPWS